MLMKGEDETRPLVDRVENFVRKYSDGVKATLPFFKKEEKEGRGVL